MSEDTPRYGAQYVPSIEERSALERLLNLAEGHTEHSNLIAEFLLAWQEAKDLNAFKSAIAFDVATVAALIAKANVRPEHFGYGARLLNLTKSSQ